MISQTDVLSFNNQIACYRTEDAIWKCYDVDGTRMIERIVRNRQAKFMTHNYVQVYQDAIAYRQDVNAIFQNPNVVRVW